MYPPMLNISGLVNWNWIEIRKASQGDMACQAFKQFLPILQVMGHCLTVREKYFQQFDRLAGHVGEGLHPHSVGL